MNDKRFELYRFQEYLVLFSDQRKKYIGEIPENVFCYEMRHSDEGFEPCELAKGILVNFYGTIFCSNEIDLGDQGFICFEESEDFESMEVMVTFDEYMDLYLKYQKNHQENMNLIGGFSMERG